MPRARALGVQHTAYKIQLSKAICCDGEELCWGEGEGTEGKWGEVWEAIPLRRHMYSRKTVLPQKGKACMSVFDGTMCSAV